MFDGVPADQLHQFIAASRTSLPLPLPNIPLSSFPNLQPFDHHHPSSYNIINPPPPPQELVQLQPPPHNQLLHPSVVLHRRENDQEKQGNSAAMVLPSSNLEIEQQRTASMPAALPGDPWSNDELLALLRIRSTMENWFPEFTWEHVSRKLAEVGFKRSAEKCKEKFEEESRYFNNINFNKNFRFLSELEQLYQPPVEPPRNPAEDQPEKINTQQELVEVEKPSEELGDDKGQPASDPQESPSNDQTVSEKEVEVVRAKSNNKKRKRQRRFEMLKGFCEDIVHKLMAQQEEIHSKLLEDMVRRDEEKLAKEEAWKKQEMDRMNKELETMAHEQAVSGDRQAIIIQFLKKFSSSASTSSSTSPSNGQKETDQEPITSSAMVPSASNVHKSTITTPTSFHTQNIPRTPTSVTEAIAPQSPSSSTLSINPKLPISSPPPENPSSYHLKTQNPSSNDKAQDLGKRWPRDEVLALINLRCSLFNNADQQDKDKDGGVVKAPLWERISQGMSELGYKRNAKRCKEKWENINKYFRKTKDVNKKRSLDSRTCPYFHQLSTLYNQGILVPPSDHQAARPEKRSPEKQSSVAEGEKINMVAAAFEFEF
ncbi:trihelix transcription factor GTL2 [Argentina anserina]|uniref:trihelix transcription factor GTL2 n=1 Tax=Argentina anserina TaxID=57926 RepID=UPI0021764FF1|nr:trihelix transcription factor GTL2 [Potentilla anserina]